MEYYTDERGILYDKVKYHTRKKHAFLKGYLDIWVERVRHNPPTLDIFDLYASTGLCYCEEAKKTGLPEVIWDGSAIIAAKALSRYSKGRLLFLNSYNTVEKMRKSQINNLIALLRGLDFKKSSILISSPIEDAVTEASKHIDPRYPSLWILDPCAASDLPWNIVEKIGNMRATYDYNGEMRIRKPELIISLMTEDLQRFVDIRPDIISSSLGMNEEIWRPKYEELRGGGLNTREAMIELYAEKLSELYEKPPILAAEINITNESAIAYCILLLTDSPAGHYIAKLKLLPEFKQWEITEWRLNARQITAELKRDPAQKTLF
jgi:three-Cys-motif partner protein